MRLCITEPHQAWYFPAMLVFTHNTICSGERQPVRVLQLPTPSAFNTMEHDPRHCQAVRVVCGAQGLLGKVINYHLNSFSLNERSLYTSGIINNQTKRVQFWILKEREILGIL